MPLTEFDYEFDRYKARIDGHCYYMPPGAIIVDGVKVNDVPTYLMGRIVDELAKYEHGDFVPVVRCKDCKHMEMTPDCLRWCNAWGGINGMGDDGFCNYGERRTDK